MGKTTLLKNANICEYVGYRFFSSKITKTLKIKSIEIWNTLKDKLVHNCMWELFQFYAKVDNEWLQT